MPETRDHITGISVEGFKSIYSEQRIDVRPLTLLAGANSSGKSSIMQPLLLMKQTIESPSDPGALLLDGPNVRFTAADQLLSRIGKRRKSEFAVTVDWGEGRHLKAVFRKERGKGFDVAKIASGDKGTKIVLEPRMTHAYFVKALPRFMERYRARAEEGKPGSLLWAVKRQRCFLELILTGERKGPIRLPFSEDLLRPGWRLIPNIQGIIHLPGLRGNPQRTYPKTAGGPFFPGTFETYAASVIAQWQSEESSHLNDLARDLDDMRLTWKVKARGVMDTHVELLVARLPQAKRGDANDLVSITDVGFGLSQVLPVVIALRVAQPGQMVYLEQPEIHLHPNAQRRLATVLRRAAERGVIAVVETHSSLLLREIQTLVARGELDRNLVKLHWFQRQKDGSTAITSADLDETGAYGDWPEDFDEVALGSEKAYLDAVEAKGTRS